MVKNTTKHLNIHDNPYLTSIPGLSVHIPALHPSVNQLLYFYFSSLQSRPSTFLTPIIPSPLFSSALIFPPASSFPPSSPSSPFTRLSSLNYIPFLIPLSVHSTPPSIHCHIFLPLPLTLPYLTASLDNPLLSQPPFPPPQPRFFTQSLTQSTSN
ncbi:hypothetical protein DPMN_076972 [Dreissena polymorpha]|uniref:Uncharacterized protein n=1 Tax=Dreissena polymorpha TaxID=45954 RepID=A0A9D4BNW9_DREPO|nr:hypothetical protein DPMN_076972 [Dreissena polymorpha]